METKMIIGLFHSGSGLGNQLHRYVATRVKALDLGVDFAMIRPDLFKGRFIDLDMGVDKFVVYGKTHYLRDLVTLVEEGTGRTSLSPSNFPFWFEGTRYYNPDWNFIHDNTIIDGEFQDERYFEHRLPEIKEWLKVEPLEMPDDVCVINFRGGEYTVSPDLFLPQEYWDRAVKLMRDKYPDIKFEVHTDDPITARKFFPEFKIWENPMVIENEFNTERIAQRFSNMGYNWRAIRYAKHLILSNSSFAIFPALLSDAKEIIAPMYWNRYNLKRWEWPSNFYRRFTYI